ncbi:MAG TPA: lipid-A-disaccharide synthase [Devosia sp.]|jgi:lipid-A-disaccharide synthase|uniref:lipid-A-disaccharide synthase n=1 Tax=Devosia sp. TaxID=1871048 RepID=UPI002F9462A0
MSTARARLKLFILAGEPSGDRIAADLMRRLKQRVELELSGVGGHELAEQGLTTLFPMTDLAVMGVSDVIKRLPLLLWRVEQTARFIRRTNPDIVVLVDAQDFSKLVGKRLKRLGYRGRIILYVAPSVWARAPQRAAKLKPIFDEVLSVLPFEPEILARLSGPPTTYVGHPALGERLTRNLVQRGPVLLLPGSRDGELRRHLPLFRAVAESLSSDPCVEGFVIPTLPALKHRLERAVADWNIPVKVVAERASRPALYQRAVLACVVSGTATLELALARVPMVVSYVLDATQARAFEKLGRPVVSLPNIVLGRSVVPELVQDNGDDAALRHAVAALLDDEKARQKQIDAFGELSDLMEQGALEHPRQDPADRVLAHWTLSGR